MAHEFVYVEFCQIPFFTFTNRWLFSDISDGVVNIAYDIGM